MGGPRRTARAGTSPAGDEGKKISRPPNAWILYRRDKVKLLAHYQQASASAIIARWWAEESPDIKSSYEQRAEIMKAEHALLYPDWQFRPQKREDKQRIREQRKLQREEARKANRRQRYSSPRAQTPYLPTQLPFPVIPNGQEQFGPQGPSPPISAASSPEPCPEPALHPEPEVIPITEHQPLPQPTIDLNASINDFSNLRQYSSTEQLPTPPNDWQVPTAPQPVSATLPLDYLTFDIPSQVAQNLWTNNDGYSFTEQDLRNMIPAIPTSNPEVFNLGTFDPCNLEDINAPLDFYLDPMGTFGQFDFADDFLNFGSNPSTYVSFDNAVTTSSTDTYTDPSADLYQYAYSGTSLPTPADDYSSDDHPETPVSHPYVPPSGASNSSRRVAGSWSASHFGRS